MRRLSLSNSAFEGDNNAYLFDGDATVLVDTGDWMDATRTQLEAQLTDYGYSFTDIDSVFLTHWHPDHTGLAGEIQEASNATVYIHHRDAPLVEGDEDAWAELHHMQESYFEQWHIPEEKRAVLRERMAGPETSGMTPEVRTFENGDTFAFGDLELEVVHSPGHTDGLCLFAFDHERGREALTGDVLLPVYTPNVGGADARVERPLEKYLRTLGRIVDADYDRAWPGHRDPIEDPAGRASQIIHHHEERAWRVLESLRQRGSAVTWEVSADLFGELEGIHILHGPGESYAHLEHLERAGTVVRDGDTYRLADGIKEKLAALEEERWELAY